MNDLRKLAEEATRNGELRSYVHGGGRLAIWDRTEPRLIADFFHENDRDYYAAASPDVILGLLDRIAELERTLTRHGPWCSQEGRGESPEPYVFVHGDDCRRDETPAEAARSSSKVETGVEK